MSLLLQLQQVLQLHEGLGSIVWQHLQSPTRNSQHTDYLLRDLTNNELQLLAQYALTTLKSRGLPIPLHPSESPIVSPPTLTLSISKVYTAKMDIYHISRCEQIACTCLLSKYDGSPNQLSPTLNLIHLHRQNEAWYCATFFDFDNVKTNLIKDFSKISLEVAKVHAKTLWDTLDDTTLHHIRETAHYHSRLFALFLFNSSTPTFAALIHSQVDQIFVWMDCCYSLLCAIILIGIIWLLLNTRYSLVLQLITTMMSLFICDSFKTTSVL